MQDPSGGGAGAPDWSARLVNVCTRGKAAVNYGDCKAVKGVRVRMEGAAHGSGGREDAKIMVQLHPRWASEEEAEWSIAVRSSQFLGEVKKPW